MHKNAEGLLLAGEQKLTWAMLLKPLIPLLLCYRVPWPGTNVPVVKGLLLLSCITEMDGSVQSWACRAVGLAHRTLGPALQANLEQFLQSPIGVEQEETSGIHLQLWTKKGANVPVSGWLTGDSRGFLLNGLILYEAEIIFFNGVCYPRHVRTCLVLPAPSPSSRSQN